MMRHIAELRQRSGWYLRTTIILVASVTAACLPLRADEAVPIALHLTPGRYERTQKLVHLITFDMSKMLKSMAGGRADDQTILEDRQQVIVLKTGNQIDITETNTRRFGGDKPKEQGSKVRTSTYQGTIAADGVMTPPQTELEDAGDGALDQLPDIPLAPGQQWTFSRHIKTERDMGDGPMTYLDKVDRIEERNGHRIAIISVTATGPITPPKDMESHGFKTAPMTLSGTAEFDTTAGLPGTQHYTAKVTWATTVMGAHIGVDLNDTYDASPVTPKAQG
ncbi:MAG: hypothetical protein JO219_08675 [Candidatus Eremiobacteraeota bacterium]|nr:hypothetical protein [Candidatus Eremiobacteraeota bacterium]MBV8365183.1 hypothetical protein [Candidatus Eremiobacteraeota bacterium]